MKKVLAVVALLFAGAISADVTPREDMNIPLPEGIFHIMLDEGLALECVPFNEYNKYFCYFVMKDMQES
jgi:hypothetical protein